MRGVNVLVGDVLEIVFRFIPTCVGLIVVEHIRVVLIAVHPHVRGVNATTEDLASGFNGSSPRAWG